MAGYVMIDLEIIDPEGFQEYLKLAGPTVKLYGGKVLIGATKCETLEGDWHPRLLASGRGRRLMKVAVIHHQGRRSGRQYATPTSARPTRDGFVVPMTFGEGADWVRNVQAAGGCVIE
jgi:hypothetical protein